MSAKWVLRSKYRRFVIRLLSMFKSRLRRLRTFTLVLTPLNGLIFGVGAVGTVTALQRGCSWALSVSLIVVSCTALFRLMWVVGAATAQAAAAATMISAGDLKKHMAAASDTLRSTRGSKKQRRERYQEWLVWSRVGGFLIGLQVAAAVFITIVFTKAVSRKLWAGSNCPIHEHSWWLCVLLLALVIASWMVAVLQCWAGTDVLAWRSLYAMQEEAWRAHYQTIFDRGIREVLCCLGRSRYWDAMDDDDIDAVAALLGDLVAYRASGATHLEVLAGMALLREGGPKAQPSEGSRLLAPPENLLLEAAALHPYAVAAYTGPLLDIGRNPLTFACVWLHRQGLLTPWARNRWPALEGDNWFRGHAAAFCRYVDISPECVRKGRVHQRKGAEAVYFVVVLHSMRCVVVAVRGTETPEDLITDSLARECSLTPADLGGLISCRAALEEGPPRGAYGHAGTVAAARELARQLDGMPDTDRPSSPDEASREFSSGEEEGRNLHEMGVLSNLLRAGGECQGYALRFVGHSLGGAVAALTALRLRPRFPNLHAYAYGVLPCVDAATAEACSSFVTSIVYNDEFASRLSVAALLRLRANALGAVVTRDANSSSTSSSSAMGTLPQRLLLDALASAGIPRVSVELVSFAGTARQIGRARSSPRVLGAEVEEAQQQTHHDEAMQQKKKCGRRRRALSARGLAFTCAHLCRCVCNMPLHSRARPLHGARIDPTLHLCPHCNQVYDYDSDEMQGERYGSHQDDDASTRGTTISSSGPPTDVDDPSSSTAAFVVPSSLLDDDHHHHHPPASTSDAGHLSFYRNDGGGAGGDMAQHQHQQQHLRTSGAPAAPGEARTRAAHSLVVLAADMEPARSRSHEDIIMASSSSGQRLIRPQERDGEKSQEEEEEEEEEDAARGAEEVAAGGGGGGGVDMGVAGELFCPGLLVHLQRSDSSRQGGSWIPGRAAQACRHRAVVCDRSSLRDLVVSPSMFLDHLPWRCQHALNDVVQQLRDPQAVPCTSSSAPSPDFIIRIAGS